MYACMYVFFLCLTSAGNNDTGVISPIPHEIFPSLPHLHTFDYRPISPSPLYCHPQFPHLRQDSCIQNN